MPLLIKCSYPFAAPRHSHLRAPPHVCRHVCRAHARPCLSTGWALNRRFDLTFRTAAVLAQGGGGVLSRVTVLYKKGPTLSAIDCHPISPVPCTLNFLAAIACIENPQTTKTKVLADLL